MNEVEEKILDEYIWNYRIEAESYRMMGKMLDEKYIKKRIDIYEISDIYIYGGTYLAAQLSRAIKKYVCLKGIVDKNGRSAINVDVPVITYNELKKIYIDEKIVITPLRFYREIKEELLQFVKAENILFLGEFLEGFV